jgi:hypothetical protein
MSEPNLDERERLTRSPLQRAVNPTGRRSSGEARWWPKEEGAAAGRDGDEDDEAPSRGKPATINVRTPRKRFRAEE